MQDKASSKGSSPKFPQKPAEKQGAVHLCIAAVFSTRTLLFARSSGDHGHQKAGKEPLQKQRLRHGDDPFKPSSTCGACLNRENGVQVWTGAFFIAKEQVGYCSQLCLLLHPKTASTISKWHNGAGARTRGRGMAEPGTSGNKETVLFSACWNNLWGWRELFSIQLDCKWTVLQRGGRRTQPNFASFETHYLEMMGFLFNFFLFCLLRAAW